MVILHKIPFRTILINQKNRSLFLFILTRMSLEFEDKDLSVDEYPDGLHPTAIYLQGDVDTRSDVILNHPDVIGFVYLNENIITKAFLAKKVVNFKTTDPNKKKRIVAVSGDTDEFTPFSVSERDIFSDSLHFTDCTQLEKNTPSISVAKFVKENEKNIPSLPNEFDTDSKLKKLKVVAFPIILPLVKGYDVPEGDIDDDDIYKLLANVDDTFADWGFLHSKKVCGFI